MQGFCEKLAKTLAPVTLMEGKMYRTEDKQQLAFKDFYLPFGGKLNPTNRWVQLAQLIPWEDLEEEYAAGFAIESGQGAPAIPFRTALGGPDH
jgi:IS5 family transposase